MNIFTLCTFPGVRGLFNPNLLMSSAPVAPVPNNILNEVPVQPAVTPGETLSAYESAVSQYTGQLELYEAAVSQYIYDMNKYHLEEDQWQSMYGLAVGGAEGILTAQVENYGSIFAVSLAGRWLILFAIGLVLIIWFSIIQGRKGIGEYE